ncbi:MAG: LysR family transcriptional regulator [Prosthecobacter sp.]
MFKHLANQSGFSLERLASLCEIAEAGSIGQASRGDANKQSQLSRQIAELEAVFGVALLARQSRPFRLTQQGKELAQAARQFFQSVDDLQKLACEQAQRVVIGAGETLIQWLLFPAVEAMKKQTTGMAFAFKNLDSTRLVDGLQQGEVDLALIRKEDVPSSLLHAGDWRYAHTAFVPKALSRTTADLKMDELASLPWAVLEGQGHFRQFLESKARTRGIKLNAALECSSYTQVAMAIETGRYAGFLPEFAKGTAISAGSAVLQRQTEKALKYERTLTLAWREATVRSRPVVEQLIPALKTQIGRLLP